MDIQQGTYELTSDKLKPLDAGKVIAKDKVSIEVAHPQPPTQIVQTAPAVQAVAPAVFPVANNSAQAATVQQTAVPAAQPGLQNASVTTNAVSPTSMSNDPTSLGDAARLARQKKQPKQK